MYSLKLYTPLRYPGGKARLAPFIAEVIRNNKISHGHYLEPYAGGAGAALELLFHGHVDHIHINDADPAIHAFWVAVTQHSEAILDLLEDTPATMDEWYRWRSILLGEMPASITERGFATLFLNRTNRSGILKGGVIGGKDQSGSYKLDARLDRSKIAARILKINQHSKQISIYCEDAKDILMNGVTFLPVNTLIYLDPPYYHKGSALYRNFYTHDDHAEIAAILQSETFPWPWIASYDVANIIFALYRKSRAFTYSLNYTVHESQVGEEAMFFSDRLDWIGSSKQGRPKCNFPKLYQKRNHYKPSAINSSQTSSII